MGVKRMITSYDSTGKQPQAALAQRVHTMEKKNEKDNK